jgi:hypothetical protein
MRKKTDDGSKPARSERLRGWWFRGVDAEPPPQREDLSSAVRTHLDGMAGHALRIERAAITDGARIRKEALTAAGTIVEHVEHLESQLALIENQFGRVIDTMRTELADLRGKLAEEAQRADQIVAEPHPVLGPVASPVPINGNGNGNGYAPTGPHALQAG